MPDHEMTRTVDAPAEDLFGWLSDVRNLPTFMHRMTRAEPAGGDAVRVTARLPDGREVEGEAWFRADGDSRRIEWGSEGPNDYRGWLQVRPRASGSEVEVHLHTERAADGEVDRGIAATLDDIARAATGNASG